MSGCFVCSSPFFRAFLITQYAAQLRQPIENSLVLCHLKTLRLYTGLFELTEKAWGNLNLGNSCLTLICLILFKKLSVVIEYVKENY